MFHESHKLRLKGMNEGELSVLFDVNCTSCDSLSNFVVSSEIMHDVLVMLLHRSRECQARIKQD